jgi:hypothetical protein
MLFLSGSVETLNQRYVSEAVLDREGAYLIDHSYQPLNVSTERLR